MMIMASRLYLLLHSINSFLQLFLFIFHVHYVLNKKHKAEIYIILNIYKKVTLLQLLRSVSTACYKTFHQYLLFFSRITLGIPKTIVTLSPGGVYSYCWVKIHVHFPLIQQVQDTMDERKWEEKRREGDVFPPLYRSFKLERTFH